MRTPYNEPRSPTLTALAGASLILGVLYGIPAYLGACAVRAAVRRWLP